MMKQWRHEERKGGVKMDECVYIAGRYSGADYNQIDQHIGIAREAATDLAKAGVRFFCAHTHTAHFDAIAPNVPEDFYIDLDNFFLEKCTAILLLDNWRESRGAREEKLAAEARGIPIFYDVEDAIMWWETNP